jgi:hypothetical protein
MTEKKRSKKDQKYQAKTLEQMFEEIDKGKELIPIVMHRSTWEELAYSIKLALKEK